MKKTSIKRYIKNKYVIAGIVVLIVVLFFVFRNGNNEQNLEFSTATMGNILEKVSVTGKISPVDKADLAFEKGGVVKAIYYKVGDKVNRGNVIAVLDSAGDAANLASAQAKLDELTRSLNPEELAVEQSKLNTAKINLDNAKRDALNAARTGYVRAQSAVTSYTDSFFTNPQSVNPTITLRTQSQTEQSNINMKRILVTDTLNKWKNETDDKSAEDKIGILIANTNAYSSMVKDFMSNLSTIVNNLNPGNSGLTQTVIDGYVSQMNSGLTSTNQSVDSVSSAKSGLENAQSAYDQANNNFLLKKSGQSSQTIAAQKASVEAYRAEFEKDSIVSPISGIITRADPNVGEFVSVGKIAFGVISEDTYKIEAYVPESDIAKISVGDIASTTLDAYGQYVDFPAEITKVDPAETVFEGVSTYKVTLQFIKKDERIRSGMTANLDILTHENNNVITIPARAVINDSGEKTVRILNADGKTYKSVPVTVGFKSFDGMIEIKSGLKVGDKVVTYIK